MRVSLGILLASIVMLASCGEQLVHNKGARILAMGDSMMAWHSSTRRSIPDQLEVALQEPVVNRAVSGARVIYGLPISGALGMRIASQYVPGDWDWVVVNGGGNDLWLGCGCVFCNGRMNRMIAPDGQSGKIVDMVTNLSDRGTRVIYIGYPRSPGLGSLIEHCKDDGDELERRLALMADARRGVHFLSLRDLVPHGDRTYHSFDMIHPSLKASKAIGEAVARIIRSEAG